MIKVLIQDGKVHEIFGDSVPPLTPELMAQIVDAPGGIREGWLYDGMKFTPPPTATSMIAQLTAEELYAMLKTKGVLTDADRLLEGT